MGESGKKESTGINRGVNAFLLICTGIIFICLVICHFAPAFDSDKVEDVIWADEALRCGRLLNPDFTYGYAMPFGGNMFILPFVNMIGIGQTANSLGMLLFFGVLTVTCFVLIRALKNTKLFLSLVGVIVILLSYCSGPVGGDYLNHILIYQLGIICITGILGNLLIIENEKKKNKIINYIGIVFFSIWGGANGVPTIVLSCVPVLSALCVIAFLETYNETRVSKRFFIECVCIMAGTIVGYILFKLSIRNIVQSDYLNKMNSYNFRNVNEWVENIYRLPIDWLELFMIRSPQGVSAFSKDCLRVLISVFESLVILVVPLRYLFRFTKIDKDEKILVLSAAFVWCAGLAQYVFFRGPEKRLLYVPCFMNFVLLAVWMIKSGFMMQKKNGMIIVVLSALTVFQIIDFSRGQQWKIDETLVNRLKETGITYGFGGYWDANFNTVYTKGKIKIRGVAFNDGEIRPYILNSESNWYDNENLEKEFFVIFNREEMDKAESYPGSMIDEMYKERIECGDRYILIFDSNVWDRGFRYVMD